MKRFILFLVLCTFVLVGQAKGRRMAVLDMPASVQSLALGGSTMGHFSGSYIYTNPGAAFQTEQQTLIDYSLLVVDEIDIHPLYLHSLAASYRANNHLLMGGVQYYNQGKLPRILNEYMEWVGNEQRLYSMRADLGYAYQGSVVQIYGSLGMATEQTTYQTTGLVTQLGANYRNRWHGMSYQLGLNVNQLGFVAYKNQQKMLSPLLQGGGSLECATWGTQIFSVYSQGGVYLPVNQTKASAVYSGGLSYAFLHRFACNMGAHGGDDDNYLSSGLSIQFQSFTVEASAKFALSDGLNNGYMMGMHLHF